jgi:hypothetical protein
MLGHVGVLLSSNFVDNGPFALTMDGFWAWFLLDKNVGGGSNGSGCSIIPRRMGPFRRLSQSLGCGCGEIRGIYSSCGTQHAQGS